MAGFRKFIVEPSLPEKLKPLQEIAYNLWWTWNPEAVNLLRRIDNDLWETTYHNPIHVIGSVSQKRLQELESDDGFITHMERVHTELTDYMNAETWFKETYHDRWAQDHNIAYLSFEFGIDECIQIYSGGLGVLAGDHLKSASDLGAPLVGVGLAYMHGYFSQYLNPDGWQQEFYSENNFYLLPLKLIRTDDGDPFLIEIPYPDRKVKAKIWKAQVGRVELLLLDTNVSGNPPEDQSITSQLYGGDIEMRIKQEILLGVGGVIALEALGKKISVYHMNEGHAAFSGVQRIVSMMKKRKFDYWQAKESVIASTVFTTHTPVPAGNDIFGMDMVEKYLSPVLEGTSVKVSDIEVLGRQDPDDPKEPFCMTVLALRISAANNGVSQLHGEVSRNMWKKIWPGVPTNLIPIRSITNGIHIRSWISEEMRNLFDRYLGMAWLTKPGDDNIWKRITKIPDAELWRTHERRRERLVGFARRQLSVQLRKRGVAEAELKRAEEIMDPEALTIGFARRFATYKRGTLILRDPERLAKILNNKERPVQIIFAGKSHPQDNEGKNFIKEIIHFARREEFRRRIVFLENYDIDVARYLVQGCDVWLNNPRRPMEASGTSGMKVSANGGLNLSVLDGWWVEGYAPETGWSIGAGETYENYDVQEAIESKAIYEILEQDIVPLFYNRGPDGLPRGWLSKMKSCMMNLSPVFNTNRMVRQYTTQFYQPLGQRWINYVEENPEIIKSLSEWKLKLKKGWHTISVVKVEEAPGKNFKVGEKKPVTVTVHLGEIDPEDIMVECYYGQMDNSFDIREGKAVKLTLQGKADDRNFLYTGAIPCDNAGLHGYSIRILPYHKHLLLQYIPKLITWG